MDELLIECVRKHPVLYDIKSSNYIDQRMRQEAWEEVGQNLRISAEDAKQKWNKLRRCFCNAINRRRSKSGGPTKAKIVPWKFELKMNFLLPFLQNRSTHIEEFEYQISQQFTDFKEEDIEEDENPIGNDNEIENNLLLRTEYSVERENFDYHNEPTVVLNNIRKQKRVKHKTSSPKQEIADIIKENKSLQPKSFCFSDMDETDMFFLSMSRMTKQLPRYEQSRIKLTLSNAVLQADIRNQEKQLELGTEQSTFSRPGSSFTNISNNSDNILLSPNEHITSGSSSTAGFKIDSGGYNRRDEMPNFSD